MACFCAAGIAHFCKLPRLPPRRAASDRCLFSCKWPGLARHRSAHCLFFCKWPGLARRAARYQKLSNPPLPLFARSANYTRFLRLIFFRHKLAVLQSCTHFCIFHLFAKNSAFFAHRNFKGVFSFFFIFAPIFQKQEFFARTKNQAPF